MGGGILSQSLDARQRDVLAAVFDAFVPGPGHDAGRARFAGLIASLHPEERGQLARLLWALDSPLLNLLLAARPRSLRAMRPEAREAVLRGWANSALPVRRRGFQALKRLAYFAELAWPDGDGTHPVWRAAGYPGPLPPPVPAPAEPALRTLVLERDTVLDCDVVVVGSGAGGGVAAGVLASAGRRVVVLEKGPLVGPSRMSQVEGEMHGRAFLDGGLLANRTGSMPILAGSCVGGGTLVNWTTSLPLPERVRAEWDALAGGSLFAGPRFAESQARAGERLGITTAWSAPGPRDAILERGCRALGWHVDAQPRNVRECRQGRECGFCGFGCRHGAKQSTMVTYLADACAQGGVIVPDCEVGRVLREGGRAAGVEGTARGTDGRVHRLTVRAKAVVAACGSIHTPALLARSGIEHPLLGRGLRLHPATAVLGAFDERVDPWTGGLQTRYSDQFADLDGAYYGAKLETAPAHFGLAATGFGWESSRAFLAELERLGHLSLVGVLLRDRDAGRVAIGRDGWPRVDYEPSTRDVAHLRRALCGAAELLVAAGAREVFTLHQPAVRERQFAAGWADRFLARADAAGYHKCRLAYVSFHQMATARMGADPSRGVVDERGEAFGLPGLFVADGSVFPTSSGVNPMLTICAIADHVARGIVGQ